MFPTQHTDTAALVAAYKKYNYDMSTGNRTGAASLAASYTSQPERGTQVDGARSIQVDQWLSLPDLPASNQLAWDLHNARLAAATCEWSTNAVREDLVRRAMLGERSNSLRFAITNAYDRGYGSAYKRERLAALNGEALETLDAAAHAWGLRLEAPEGTTLPPLRDIFKRKSVRSEPESSYWQDPSSHPG